MFGLCSASSVPCQTQKIRCCLAPQPPRYFAWGLCRALIVNANGSEPIVKSKDKRIASGEIPAVDLNAQEVVFQVPGGVAVADKNQFVHGGGVRYRRRVNRVRDSILKCEAWLMLNLRIFK